MSLKITKILTHWNYEQALKVFLQESDNDFLKEIFMSGDDEYNSSRLKEELEKLVQAAEEPTQMAASPEVKVMHKERDYLRHNLESYQTDEQRYKAADRILELDQQLRAYYNQFR